MWSRLGVAALVAMLGLSAVATVAASPATSAGSRVAEQIAFQEPVTPTPAPLNEEPQQFRISFLDLGYGERQLVSPFSSVEYTLNLPEGWQLTEESYLELELSYAYTQAESVPPFFGELGVVVDGETQLLFSIDEPTLEHVHLQVPLPPDLFNVPGRNQHTVELTLDADLLCETAHKANLIVHPTSFFSLNYNLFPLTIDLADLPRPFFQDAFEPDRVRFVLAEAPTSIEMAGALAIAARLGELSGNQLVFSSAGDLEWLARLEAEEASDEHLVIVGQPENHRLLSTLNELQSLPVSFRERQMQLSSRGPAVAAPGDLITFTLTVTNTSRRAASGLALADRLPWQAQLVDCEPRCAVDGETGDQVRWSLRRLLPNGAVQFSLVLSASDVLTRSLMENTVVLLNDEDEPINVDTLTTTLAADLAQAGSRSSFVRESQYFFVWDGQAVAETRGVVQEIVSPWDAKKAILIATGLDERAVRKASQALSSRAAFPGMEGPVALVSQVRRPAPLSTEGVSIDRSFAALGYDDRIAYGAFRQNINYSFFLPASWRLTEDSFVELVFAHAGLLNLASSSLTVLLNNTPLGSIPLDKETASGATLRVKLLDSAALHGRKNRLSLRVNLAPEDICSGDSSDLWLTVSRDSYLHLGHQERDAQRLDLSLYPYPFDSDPYLSDVLFALPRDSRPMDWDTALRLAAELGTSAGGPALLPTVALTSPQADELLSHYHIIAIGRPSTNPWLQNANAQLPQPFRPGSDRIEQRLDDIVFQLPPDLDLGFVQLISSPWNEERALLAVTGTTDQAVQWAADALVNRPWVLDGNLTLIKDTAVRTLDTRGATSGFVAETVATAVPEIESTAVAAVSPTRQLSSPTPTPLRPTSTPEIPDLPTPRKINRPNWLVPLLGLNGLAVVTILGIAFWRAKRRR